MAVRKGKKGAETGTPFFRELMALLESEGLEPEDVIPVIQTGNLSLKSYYDWKRGMVPRDPTWVLVKIRSSLDKAHVLHNFRESLKKEMPERWLKLSVPTRHR